MVAKSYQALQIVGEPHTKSGSGDKLYVFVKDKRGNLKEVRWYNEAEYAKMYPEAEPERKILSTQKKVLGFEKGYITIFKGDVKKHQEWFEYSCARFCVHWGWYIISTDEIPFDLPAGVEPVRLDWDLVGNDTGELKDKKAVEVAVGSLLNSDSKSRFQGQVGQRLDLNITVIDFKQADNFFGGRTATHTFEDACGNHYMWNTGSQFWAEGLVKHIRGTVKEHKVIDNIQTTVLTRCAEMK
jgi:hypothetical protein